MVDPRTSVLCRVTVDNEIGFNGIGVDRLTNDHAP
jgi:hypothetical protein